MTGRIIFIALYSCLPLFLLLVVILQQIPSSHAFAPTKIRKSHHATAINNNNNNLLLRRKKNNNDPLYASTTASSSNSLLERRKTLLSRDGPYFKIDRENEAIEFGATAKLVTKLNDDENGKEYIREWLSDERRVAMSIWDEDLITPTDEESVYKLQLMKLQFVTIQLQPTVDMRMWSRTSSKTNSPVFYLQSVDFDPNIQVLPGLGTIDAKTLGIKIEVVGQLAPTSDGMGVAGRIAFQTSGKLPPPLLLLPEGIIKAASDAINNTITQFAIASFQKGAISKYKEFVKAKKEGLL
eukprot:CAMPEP_0194178782 /NCGR_PEP_ID=MMETSP0154-20130528/12319_1 /TAXON_ID=1049557 /ORGANISM="Thalassiothrix antarctica, Strain L6-D1" /LENGTH=295 /DNA_ID=CAMNT_0038893853 /DNA_START=23 /DNA_END=910 /DNA_ORIENTATION=-